jgi:hypothetical protein
MSESMTRPRRALSWSLQVVLGAALLAASPMVLAAQGGTPPTQHKMDRGAMNHGKEQHGEDHAASGWKELDMYHALMMATWHPAKDKNDLAAIRAQAPQMVESATTLAKSTAPARCDTPRNREAAAKLPAQTRVVADLVTKQADDATLKAALKTLHDQFEVLEEGCAAPGAKQH